MSFHFYQFKSKNKNFDFFKEAFNILKQEVHKNHPTIDPNDDSVDFIETIKSPTESHVESWTESLKEHEGEILLEGQHDVLQEEALNNDDGYEYFIDENSAQRRMIRLLRRISRVGDISNGIYHPTLVPSEDKRIAGVSNHFIHLFIEYKSYLIAPGQQGNGM